MPDSLPVVDAEMFKNIGKAAPIGLVGGVVIELLRRKMRNQLPELKIPEQEAALPMIDRPVVQKKEKKADITLGHAIGGIGAAGLGMSVVGRLLNRKKRLELDSALAQRDKEFNELLMHEQGLAAGIPAGTMGVLKSAALNDLIDDRLTKIAGDLFDRMEKKGDIAIKDLMTAAKKALGVLDDPAGQTLAGAAGLGGLGYGYHLMSSKDPNTIATSSIRKALQERLTGKDNNVGPMPIRVETDQPEMRPLKPGASALVDPTKGRDVLEGI